MAVIVSAGNMTEELYCLSCRKGVVQNPIHIQRNSEIAQQYKNKPKCGGKHRMRGGEKCG